VNYYPKLIKFIFQEKNLYVFEKAEMAEETEKAEEAEGRKGQFRIRSNNK